MSAASATGPFHQRRNETGLCTDSPAVNRTLYRYHAMGARVEKRTGDGNITRYLYDAGQLAAEYTNAPVTDSGRRYLTTDHLGTTRVITNPTGTILTRRDYFPFGEEISPATLATGNLRSSISAYGDNTISSTTVRFTGKERDAETGLDYFAARYLSAAQGRYTSPDWSSVPQAVPYADLAYPQSLNLYAYVRNNPLTFTDLDGHDLDCSGENAQGVGCQFLIKWNTQHGVDLARNATGFEVVTNKKGDVTGVTYTYPRWEQDDVIWSLGIHRQQRRQCGRRKGQAWPKLSICRIFICASGLGCHRQQFVPACSGWS